MQNWTVHNILMVKKTAVSDLFEQPVQRQFLLVRALSVCWFHVLVGNDLHLNRQSEIIDLPPIVS